MNFDTIILDQSKEIRQHYAIQILTALLLTLKTNIFFEDISSDVEKWFDTSNYNKKDKIPLPIDKNKKVLALFKEELGEKIVTEFVALRAKTYAYLDDGNEHKKSTSTKRCVIKKTSCFKISKIVCSRIKLFIDHSKDLEAIIMMFTQKKLIRLR